MKRCDVIGSIGIAGVLALCASIMGPSWQYAADANRSNTRYASKEPTRRATASGIASKAQSLSPGTKRSSSPYTQSGMASWYSTDECRTRSNPRALTASGEALDDSKLTAAHRSLPFGTVVRVLSGGKSVLVRVNDSGPSNRYPDRIIDLSRAAFERIGSLDRGLIPVEIEVVK